MRSSWSEMELGFEVGGPNIIINFFYVNQNLHLLNINKESIKEKDIK